jgi:hypothetical protein
VVASAQSIRHALSRCVNARKKLLPQDKQNAQQGVLFYGLTQLRKERTSCLPMLRLRCEELLELVKDDQARLRQTIRVQEVGTLGEDAPYRLAHRWLPITCNPGGNRIGDEGIATRASARRGRLHAYTRYWKNLESMPLEIRNESCIDQRTFSSPRLCVEQDDLMSRDEGAQCIDLALAPEEEPLFHLLKGARPHEWLSDECSGLNHWPRILASVQQAPS